MGWALGIATYVVIWWVTLFAVLPWGVKSQHESGEMVPGSDPGAPKTPHLGLKLLVNSGVAFAVWLALFALVEAGVIPI